MSGSLILGGEPQIDNYPANNAQTDDSPALDVLLNIKMAGSRNAATTELKDIMAISFPSKSIENAKVILYDLGKEKVIYEIPCTAADDGIERMYGRNVRIERVKG